MKLDPRNVYTKDGVLRWYGTGRELKLYLLEKFKNCFWCNIPVKDHQQEEGIPNPDDMGTIDHMTGRLFREKYQVVEKVLACNKCNYKRSLVEMKEYKKLNRKIKS
ncbi:MAG TPA: hypothetical protein VNX68_10950 [Nitrosopumilaceae archaeon]|jgi:hypothetical protein|nr:hypothetical protein [Nitrosopumilaceae archaeon]